MTPESFKRVRTLFDRASDLPPQNQRAFLEKECSDAPDILDHVLRLLASDGDRVEVIGRRIRDTIEQPAEERLGEYQLLRCLGQGGMGEVWLAQQDPPLERLVAIKVIKPGFDTRKVTARFELERRTLAMMNHPSIARVYDAGTTPLGRPYFVMEYVEGQPINDYCDERDFGVRQRLELFATVCDAVSHAHRKAVIHRDLKPANILVIEENGLPLAKIIDFGIAKAMSSEPAEETMLTALGQAAGTPDYMSPEQRDTSGKQLVDTRTDVFGLGVVLYELLTGRLPFTQPIEGASGSSSNRLVRPSAAITNAGDRDSLAQRRGTRAHELIATLKGDLDWIVQKALSYEMDRRYESVDAFRQDIDHFLSARPVQARPPSWGYLVSRFVRRHRFVVTAATVITLAVLIGVGGTLVGMQQARQAEAEALQQAQRARQTLDFLVDSFRLTNPMDGGSSELKARELLDAGVERLSTTQFDDPAAEAMLRRVIGGIYGDLAFYDEAIEQLELAIDQSKTSAENQMELLESRQKLALTYWARGPVQRAEVLQREVVEDLLNLRGPNDSTTLAAKLSLAQILLRLGRDDEATEWLRRIEQTGEGDTLFFFYNIASLQAGLALRAGDLESAEEYQLQAVSDRRETMGPDHMVTRGAQLGLGRIFAMQGRFDEARTILEKQEPFVLDRWGPNHKGTYRVIDELGELERLSGNFEQAELRFVRSREGFARLLTSDHPDLLRTGYRLGYTWARLGKQEAAIELLKSTLANQAQVFGSSHRETLATASELELLCGQPYDDKGGIESFWNCG